MLKVTQVCDVEREHVQYEIQAGYEELLARS